jgi:hypothetical protein
MVPTALLGVFQKSTVFEKVAKHRETVAEVNVFERSLPPSSSREGTNIVF